MIRILFSLAILSCSFSLYGQLLPSKFKDIPPQHQELLHPDQLQDIIDSVQQYAAFDVVARYRPLHLKNDNALFNLYRGKEQFSWKISHSGLLSRVYCDISRFEAADTLYFLNGQGEIRDKLHLGKISGNSYTGLPLSDLQFMVLRRGEHSRASVLISGISLELPENTGKGKQLDFGDSDPCEVNANCPEGERYTDVKNAVVRILVQVGNNLGWCTGSIVNNTSYDYTPYLLTAEHCGIIAGNFVSAADLSNWTFYFNFQSEGCDNPSRPPIFVEQLRGAQLRANSNDNGGDRGSDFLLLELNSAIPEKYNVFYAGWNMLESQIPEDGATIHHPAGDIKKISTYTSRARSGSFGDQADDTHWLVSWVKTRSGYGVTEGGSSGAPLFDENLLIRGTLTGGSSSCEDPSAYDYFGKFSYSWSRNGDSPERRLQDWLDPMRTGYRALPGAYLGEPAPTISSELEVLPNPVKNGELRIKNVGKPEQDITILLSDMSGKIVYEAKVAAIPLVEEQINVTGLRNGLYLLYVFRNDDIVTRKVFITN